jgi:hypothetical protein
MEEIQFVWDEDKASENIEKHGISFSEAKTVFYDENARLRYDPDHSDDEDRFILLGMSYALRVLVVCHCYRERDTFVRIISARKASHNERKQYEKFLQ